MASINMDQIATDSTDTLIDYGDATTALPDFSALDAAFDDFGKMLNDFFAFENHPQISFYDTPQGAIFRGFDHKEVQTKRRILEYRAKY
jgi:hypothetical protein